MEPDSFPKCPVTGVCPEARCANTEGALQTAGNTGKSSLGHCELSLLRDIQKPSGYNFGQLGLGCQVAWTGGWSLGGSFQLQQISNSAKTFQAVTINLRHYLRKRTSENLDLLLYESIPKTQMANSELCHWKIRCWQSRLSNQLLQGQAHCWAFNKNCLAELGLPFVFSLCLLRSPGI